MKRIFFFLLIIPFMAFQSEKLVKTEINEAITVSLPSSFMPVGEQELSAKYVSYRKPIALYTSSDKTTDFSVNVSVTQWRQSDLPLMKDFYKSSLSTLYSEMKMLREDVVEIKKIPFAIFEYIGTVEGEESAVRRIEPISKYTYLAYGLVNGKVVVFTFSSPAKQKDRWAPVAEEIMSTIKINKKTL